MPPLVTTSAPAPRQFAGFTPSVWGDRFLNYIPADTKVIEAQENMAKELKEEIRMDLQSIGDKPLKQQLCLIDSIERLGIGYHFEMEIEDALKRIYETSTDTSSDDLVLASLLFRLLRQHGYRVSSDVFKAFIDSNGRVKEEVWKDVKGMLSLYEACYLAVHGEDLLDEVLSSTISNLNKFLSDPRNLDGAIEERIRHALKKPLNRRMIRVECVRYMRVYDEDHKPSPNKNLLKFAKLDFNLVQELHKKELRDVCRWWKSINVTGELPLRDRMVEAYFWGSGAYFEPRYALARKWLVCTSQSTTTMDDSYDAFLAPDEIPAWTDAINKWDKSCLGEIPQVLRETYQNLVLNAHEEMEREFAAIGRSQYVSYAIKEFKGLCNSYHKEAMWLQNKYIPTLAEYTEIADHNIFLFVISYAFVGMEEATEAEFEWVSRNPKAVTAVCMILRIRNDLNGEKLVENREHPCLLIECYMKEFGLSHEEACKMLRGKIGELWKDLNEALMRPTEVPIALVKCIINLARTIEELYDDEIDGFTINTQVMNKNIHDLYIDPIQCSS